MGLHPANAATAPFLTALALIPSSSASPASTSRGPWRSSVARSGASDSSTGTDCPSSTCARRARSHASEAGPRALSPNRSTWTTPASATATSTLRSRSAGATTATRSILAGSRTSGHRIEQLHHVSAASRRDLKRGASAPGVNSEKTYHPNARGHVQGRARRQRSTGDLEVRPP